jgi:hypothetical protein
VAGGKGAAGAPAAEAKGGDAADAKPAEAKKTGANDVASVKEALTPEGTASAKARRGDLGIDEVTRRLGEAADKEDGATRDVRHAVESLKKRADIREALLRLDERTALPEMSRKLRKLAVPRAVTLLGYGNKTAIRNPLQATGDNEYTGTFGDLKESIAYTVAAEDYYTATRAVTLVQPPTLAELKAEEDRPAYLYYRPYWPDKDASPADLKGKKQSFVPHDVLSSGEKIKIEVPAGTDLRLIAKADKDLDADKLVLAAPPKSESVVTQKAVLQTDRRTFTINFTNVQKEITFELRYTDLDGVEGRRGITVAPTPDNPPNLPEVLVEKMRKVTLKSGNREQTYYMVTKKARIPFSAKIDDDHGLAEVRYRYTIGREGGDPTVAAVFRVPGLLLLTPNLGAGLMDTRLQAAAYLAAQDDLDKRDEERALNLTNIRYYSPPLFTRTLRGSEFEFVPMNDVRDALKETQPWEAPKKEENDNDRGKKPPFHRLLREFKIKPDDWVYDDATNKNAENGPLECDFPLFDTKLWPMDAKGNPLYPTDDSHAHLRMNLSVEAIDTNPEDPASPDGQVGSSKERFPFLIVTENELLVQIGLEEVDQYKLLYVKYNELDQKKPVLDTAVFSIHDGMSKNELEPPIKRAEEIQTALDTSFNTVKTVLANYQRILREEQLNQVNETVVNRVQGIVNPGAGADPEDLGLEALVKDQTQNGPSRVVGFPETQKAVEEWKAALDDAYSAPAPGPTPAHVAAAQSKGKAAQEKMDRLNKNLFTVLEKMGGLITKAELANRLAKIGEEVKRQETIARIIKERKENELFDPPSPPK